MGVILPGVRNYLSGRRSAGPPSAPSPVRLMDRTGGHGHVSG